MRIVNVIFLLLMLALLAGGGYSAYRTNEAQLARNIGRDHANLAQGFSNMVWKMHRHKLLPLFASGRSDIADEVDVAVFAADAESYFNAMQIASVSLFSPHGELLASVNGKDQPLVAPPGASQIAGLAESRQPVNFLVHNGYSKMLVQSVLPLVKDGKTEIMVVLTSDGGPESMDFLRLLGMLLGAVALVSLAVYVLGYLNTRRVENFMAKQYEEKAALIEAASQARAETEQKSQFLANISHELRTPLNAIIGFSDILKNDFVPQPGQSQHANYINDIHSAGTHLLSLINDILDYSKAEAGKLELEVTEVNAVKIIQNSIRLIQPRAEVAQVRIVESLPRDQITLTTDSKKLRQILLNLLSNAVKFTPSGGMVKVSAWIDMHSDNWVFEVHDSGIGIAPKDISRAMAPFGQVDNALSRKFEGTGLGLPLTKKFVELMGGKFSIESEVDKGTTVTFSLPREFKPVDGVIVKQVA